MLLVKIAAAAAGLLGVTCSAMVYADTHREFWRASQCFGKFFGSTLVLGTAVTLAL
jgi:DMSO reductase anchor subunit